MNKQWGLWVFLGIMVGVVILAVNMQNRRSTSEVFPEDEFLTDIEYQYEPEDAEGIGAQKAAGSDEASMAQTAAGVLTPDTGEQKPSAESTLTAAAAVQTPSGGKAKTVYTIQVAAFKERGRAELELRKVQAMGYEAMMERADLGDKGVWYRVYVGPFHDKTEASSKLGALRSSYGQGFIRKLSR